MSLPTDSPSCNACGRGRTTKEKHTCWRKGSDNQSDEELPTAKEQPTDTQTNEPGSVKDGGHQFEMKMAALIGLRGLHRGDDFELFSNRDDAGNFDDLVYTAGGRRYFLQLKHADNPDKKKLTKGDLVTLLQSCFKSYCAIKNGDTFKDTPIDNSEFIVYTNKELMPTLLKHKRRQKEIDILFKTFDKGEIFSFSPDDKNKDIDFYTLLDNSVTQSKEFRDLGDRGIVNEFLNKLIMVTGQKGQRDLDEVIIKEIRKYDATSVNEMYEAELLEFKTLVENWCRGKKDKMTATIFRNWLQEAKTKPRASVVRNVMTSCTKKLARTGILFSNSEMSRFQAELSNKRAFRLKSDALTLCSILLLDCLATSKCIFVNFESLQGNKNMVFNAWLGGHWEWLIVSCDSTVQQSDISDTCLTISGIIKPELSNKRVIILTGYSVQKVRDFVPIEHEFSFEQLSEASQEMVLDKKIEFQGCEVTMRSVLQQHGDVEHVLGPELVTDLVTDGTVVNVGGKLHVNTGYYAPRVLEREVWLYSTVLRNPNDVFAVSGATEEEVLKIVPSGKTIQSISLKDIYMTDFTQDMSSRIFLLSEGGSFSESDEDVENIFLAICKKVEAKSLQWVEFNNGHLLWKMSRGGTDSLQDYVNAEKTRADRRIVRECMKSGKCEVKEGSIWNLDERTVLVVAEPGMGKSSTTTHVARHTKERDPTSWVVRINWNDHTRKLQEINAATFNFDSLLEFLCTAALPDSEYTDFNRSLLKQALQSSGNVTVLMDGFDEISPTHADKAAVILSELMKTKVGRLWVTSRPVEKEKLEKKLSVISFSMKRLSCESQHTMLCNLLMNKAGGKEWKIESLTHDLLRHLSVKVKDKLFAGCPLYITMIAEACETDMETCLNSEGSYRPKIDLVNLYETFVERKLHIYLTQKQKSDTSNSCVLHDHKILKQTFLLNFEKCALAAILPATMLESLDNKEIEEEIQPFLDRVQAGEDKTGIVMNMVDGKPQFIHRTFAEYFVALWFSKKFKSNRSVLEHILLDRKYSFVKYMFDRMLARGCPLIWAVLEGDKENVRTLLKDGRDVNAVDKGGRNLMHLLVTSRATGEEFYVGELPESVRQYAISLDTTDFVLQWTPLQYAIKLEDWYFVAWLLKKNVDRTGLDMIRQRADDPEYIGRIMYEAVESSSFLLLEFLCSIGVNINQARCGAYSSPLQSAIWYGDTPVVRWLIQHGADCNTRDSGGQTLLFDAVTKCSLDAVRVLVEEGGASVDVRNECGRTAIDWAKYCEVEYRTYVSSRAVEMHEIIEYLRERGCTESSTAQENNDT